jgi:hypothetical protein
LKIEGRLARWLIAFGVRLLRVWERTLRYEVDDRAGIVGQPVTENYIGALWHNRLLIFPLVLRRFFPNRPGAALISRPHHVKPTGTPEEFETERLRVQDAMMALVEMR